MGEMDKIFLRLARHYKVERTSSIPKDELVSFFKAAYADQFSAPDHKDENDIMGLWEWANLKNPNIVPGQFPAWICRKNSDNKIVGHFAIIPVSVKFRSSSYPAAWGRDLIVLPEYRKLGIGPFLINAVLKDTAGKARIFLIAGLNEYIYSVYKKFGFADMGHIPLYVRINRLDRLLREKIRNNIVARALGIFGKSILSILYMPSNLKRLACRNSGETVIKEITHFDASFDNLWERASQSLPIAIIRNSTSLNWRFVNQPYGAYKIFKAEDGKDKTAKGYIVLREGESKGFPVGIISDLFAASDDRPTISSLLDCAITYFEGKGDTCLIRCDILNDRFERVIRKFGFMRIRSSSHFMLTNIHGDLDPEFAARRNNWFIDYADSDLDLSGKR